MENEQLKTYTSGEWVEPHRDQWGTPDVIVPDPSRVIHVAYVVQLRGGRQYRARAYVGEHRKPCHSLATAIEDTADLAVDQAIKYIIDMHRRDGVPPPTEVVRHGKTNAAMLDHLLF
jgi:hypothetical protein